MYRLLIILFTVSCFAALGQGEAYNANIGELKAKLFKAGSAARNQLIFQELTALDKGNNGYDLHFIQSIDSLLVVDQALYLDNLFLIGRRLSLDGNKREAYTFLNRVLSGLDKGQKIERICDFYEAIGDCYFFFKNFEQSKLFLLKAIKCPQINDLSKINVFNTLGLIHMKSDNVKAEVYFLSAIEVAEKLNHDLWYGVITGNIGALNFDRGNYDLALRFFETDSKISLEHRLYESAIQALSKIIEIHILKEDLSQAKFWMAKLDSVAHPLTEIQKGDPYYSASSKYNAFVGNYELAYSHYIKANYYIDSFDKVRSEIHNKNMEFQIAYERQLAQFNILEEQSKSDRKTKYGLIILILSITIGSFVSIFQIIKRRKREKELFELKSRKAAENLDRMEQELKSSLKSLIEKNNTINALNNDLQELFSHVEGSDDEKLNLTDKLQSFTLLTDEDWAQFKHLFEKRYPGFFGHFLNAYPGITNAELRLAALLKLNLENIEISKALGIGADSVRKTNLRLRKRLELEDQRELLQLIQSISN